MCSICCIWVMQLCPIWVMGLFDGVAVEGRRPVFKLPGSLFCREFGVSREGGFSRLFLVVACFCATAGSDYCERSELEERSDVFSLPAFEVLARVRVMVFGSTFLGRTRRAEVS